MYPSELVFLFSLGKYLVVQLLDHRVVLFLHFKEPPYCFREWLHQFACPPTVQESFPFSISSPTPVVSCVTDFSHSDKCEVMSHYSLICIFLIIRDVEHLFMCLLWKNCLFMPSVQKLFKRDVIPLDYFFCFLVLLLSNPKKKNHSQDQYQGNVPLYFLSWCFRVSGLTFRSSIHFEFIFLYMV